MSAKFLLFKSVSAVRNRSFSYDVSPLLISNPNSETATSPVGVEPFPYVETFHFFFLTNKLA